MQPLSEAQSALYKNWAANWKTVGVELDALEKEELRNQSDADHLAAFHDVLVMAEAFPTEKTITSGMVEMQQVMQSLRHG